VGIRETLNKNSTLTTIGTICIVVLALLVIVFEMRPKAVKLAHALYYSSDDGKTWFPDEMTKNAPFDKDGQEADLAHVYSCNGGAPFVLYLEKLTPDMKATLDNPDHGDVNVDAASLVKKPGDATWLKKTSKDGKELLAPKCPDGSTNGIAEVLPEP
jgi:hypothetical protein